MNAQVETIEGELITATRHEIAKLDPFQRKLDEFHKRYDDVVYDMDVEQDNKQARSDQRAIGTVVAELDRRHADIKEPLLEATRMLDGRRKEIKDGLRNVQGKIKSQIEAHEEKEKARVDGHYEAVQAIYHRGSSASNPALTAEDLRAMLADAMAVVAGEAFEEFVADAELARTIALGQIDIALLAADKRETEQVELAALRAEKEERDRADRDVRIATEATENANRKTQQAIAEATARAERAAREERERIELEQAREKADEERRAKQKTHRARVHKEATDSLLSLLDLSEDDAQTVIETIASGLVKNVSIQY